MVRHDKLDIPDGLKCTHPANCLLAGSDVSGSISNSATGVLQSDDVSRNETEAVSLVSQ
jgi:hypothetical protein